MIADYQLDKLVISFIILMFMRSTYLYLLDCKKNLIRFAQLTLLYYW